MYRRSAWIAAVAAAMLAATSTKAQAPPPMAPPPVGAPTGAPPPTSSLPPPDSSASGFTDQVSTFPFPDSQGGSNAGLGSEGSLAFPDPPSSNTGSSIMDFSSDGATDGGAWTPIPGIDTGSWPIDWSWNGSNDSSSSSSYTDIGDEAGVELFFPGIDGAVAKIRRHKYVFNPTEGFTLNTTNATEGVPLGRCGSYPYCMHFVFESDYGAMSPFDAFVLDRYESAAGPVALQGVDWVSGAVPLVLGRFPPTTLEWLKGNWSEVFNWNETRRTTWSLHPTSGSPSEIDITLSLKQLYTLLPGYNGTNISSNGPFYSADLSDQIIIRVNSKIASPFAGASATLPIVVNHSGSKLFDINVTTALLYEGNGVNGGNEIQVTFKLSRRKYGAFLPWFPAKPADECLVCMESLELPEAFSKCLDHQLAKQHLVFEDLLSFQNNRDSFDVEPSAKHCFAAITNGEWANVTQDASPMVTWNGSDWVVEDTPATNKTIDKWQLLRQTDAALRCWSKTRCAIGGATVKSDAQVVVLHHSPARTTIRFDRQGYSYWLSLGLEDAGDNELITTPIFHHHTPVEDVAAAIANAFPNAHELMLDIEVRKSDNLEEIAAIERDNQAMMDVYNSAHQWSSTIGSDGSGTGDVEAGSTSGASPQMPMLHPVPLPTFLIEIISHNITVVPHVRSVHFSDASDVSNWSNDNRLFFHVAPLNVSKFQYVPPPSHVDLHWQAEPDWMASVRSRVPMFLNDSDVCGDCVSQLNGCLFDPDCAFGVNYFFADAMGEDRLDKSVEYETDNTTGHTHARYSADATATVLAAKKFFPPGGYDRLISLLDCLAARPCNVDKNRTWWNGTQLVVETPTSLSISPASVVLDVVYGETVTLSTASGSAYDFSATGETGALSSLLVDKVLAGQSAFVKQVSVSASAVEWNADNSVRRLQYNVTWAYPLVPVPSFLTKDTSSSATYTPWRLEIHTQRVIGTGFWDAGASQVLHWQRLKWWLDIFSFVPYGIQRNGTGTSHDKPTFSATSVCPPCEPELWACVSTSNCTTSMAKWLPTVFPLNSSATSVLGHDGLYRSSWNVGALNNNTVAHRETFLRLASCVGKYGCAVDYTPMNTSSGDGVSTTWVPSHLSLQTTRIVHSWNPKIRLKYRSIDGSFARLDEFAAALYDKFKEVLTYSVKRNGSTTEAEYTLVSSFDVLDKLEVYHVWTYGTEYETWKTMANTGQFVAQAPTQPSWRHLLAWLGLNKTSSTPATDCATCQPALQACFEDAECWRSVQQHVVPLLRGTVGMSGQQEGSHWVYMADIGQALRDVVLESTSSFATAESRHKFFSILQCLAASGCDVDSMGAAAEPPATAYVPTTLVLQPASASLLLYMDTALYAGLNGLEFTYYETGTGNIDALLGFFATVFAVANPNELPFSIGLQQGDGNAYSYSLAFHHNYLGRLPVLSISSAGHVTGDTQPFAIVAPWDAHFKAVDKWPQWDRLLSLLSVSTTTPPSTQVPPLDCPDAAAIKQLCYANLDCVHVLKTGAIPAISQALLGTQPSYNSELGRFDLDISGLLAWEVVPLANGDALAANQALNVIRESVVCPLPASAQLVFDDARVEFTRPATGPLRVLYDGRHFEFHDEDPANEGLAGFQQFMYDTFVAGSVVEGVGGPVLYFWAVMEGQVHYDLRFSRIYAVPPPHFYWTEDQGGGARADSVDTPWRAVLRSPTTDMYDKFASWLAWLATPDA